MCAERPAYDTETRILEAAKKMFIMNGLDGTSMQQIADEANINKSLLHYYFRNKEKLFNAVFIFAFQHFVPQINDVINSGESIEKKIEKLVDEYIELLTINKFIPAFILHEINRDPERVYKIMQNTGINPDVFIRQIMQETNKGIIRPMDPRHLIVNILSLCIFPIAARPLLQRLLFNNDDIAYEHFIRERKKTVTDFVINSIKT
jgi:AcrR family transcriptional regulator